jgi:DNA-directed RNA polymerase specialized sigma24 family protein
MASPSPLDLCWSVTNAPKSELIAPAVRAAVEGQWEQAKQIAAVALGDEALAAEIMEVTIERTAAHLAQCSQFSDQDAQAALARFYKREVRRRQAERRRLVFNTAAIESLSSPAAEPLAAVDAQMDLEKILTATPPHVRTALLMRYGSCESWSEVAAKMATSKDAIRKICKRQLDIIRQRLRIAVRSK